MVSPSPKQAKIPTMSRNIASAHDVIGTFQMCRNTHIALWAEAHALRPLDVFLHFMCHILTMHVLQSMEWNSKANKNPTMRIDIAFAHDVIGMFQMCRNTLIAPWVEAHAL